MGEPTAGDGGARRPITVEVADGVATLLLDLPGESVNTLSLEVGRGARPRRSTGWSTTPPSRRW